MKRSLFVVLATLSVATVNPRPVMAGGLSGVTGWVSRLFAPLTVGTRERKDVPGIALGGNAEYSLEPGVCLPGKISMIGIIEGKSPVWYRLQLAKDGDLLSLGQKVQGSQNLSLLSDGKGTEVAASFVASAGYYASILRIYKNRDDFKRDKAQAWVSRFFIVHPLPVYNFSGALTVNVGAEPGLVTLQFRSTDGVFTSEFSERVQTERTFSEIGSPVKLRAIKGNFATRWFELREGQNLLVCPNDFCLKYEPEMNLVRLPQQFLGAGVDARTEISYTPGLLTAPLGFVLGEVFRRPDENNTVTQSGATVGPVSATTGPVTVSPEIKAEATATGIGTGSASSSSLSGH